MGGELGGPGGEAPQFRPRRTRGASPPGLGHCVQGGSGFTSARLPNGGPGACPRFGRLG